MGSTAKIIDNTNQPELAMRRNIDENTSLSPNTNDPDSAKYSTNRVVEHHSAGNQTEYESDGTDIAQNTTPKSPSWSCLVASSDATGLPSVNTS